MPATVRALLLFVQVYWNNELVTTTAVKKSTLNPVWDHVHRFKVLKPIAETKGVIQAVEDAAHRKEEVRKMAQNGDALRQAEDAAVSAEQARQERAAAKLEARKVEMVQGLRAGIRAKMLANRWKRNTREAKVANADTASTAPADEASSAASSTDAQVQGGGNDVVLDDEIEDEIDMGDGSETHAFFQSEEEEKMQAEVAYREVIEEEERQRREIAAASVLDSSTVFVGATVGRGIDWHWEDQDGGDGNSGEILGFRRLDGTEEGAPLDVAGVAGVALVKWHATGLQQTCEMGHNDLFQLRLLSPHEAAAAKLLLAASAVAAAETEAAEATAKAEAKAAKAATAAKAAAEAQAAAVVKAEAAAAVLALAAKKSNTDDAAQLLTGSNISLEARVVRGRDWNWEDDDGGEGNQGIVLGFRREDGSEEGADTNVDGANGVVLVRWLASGGEQTYEMGWEDKFSLNLATAGAPTHPVAAPASGNASTTATQPPSENAAVAEAGVPTTEVHSWDASASPSNHHHHGALGSCPLTGRNVTVGCSVARGVDWNWEDHDGGVGCAGTVLGFRRLNGHEEGDDVKVEGIDGVCVVRWIANETEQTYEMGFDGLHALRLLTGDEETAAKKLSADRLLSMVATAPAAVPPTASDPAAAGPNSAPPTAAAAAAAAAAVATAAAAPDADCTLRGENAFIGAVVGRGRDWTWDDHDGGAGHSGIVLGFRRLDGSEEGADPKIHGIDGITLVRWPASGEENTYEMGCEGKFSLTLLSPADAAAAAEQLKQSRCVCSHTCMRGRDPPVRCLEMLPHLTATQPPSDSPHRCLRAIFLGHRRRRSKLLPHPRRRTRAPRPGTGRRSVVQRTRRCPWNRSRIGHFLPSPPPRFLMRN